MNVIAFNGSARKGGNTAILLRQVLTELEQEGISTELVELSGKKIYGCTACMKCFTNKDQRCSVKDDIINDCIEKMLAADGIIIGSPTYFADLSPQAKARTGMVARANSNEGLRCLRYATLTFQKFKRTNLRHW